MPIRCSSWPEIWPCSLASSRARLRSLQAAAPRDRLPGKIVIPSGIRTTLPPS